MMSTDDARRMHLDDLRLQFATDGAAMSDDLKQQISETVMGPQLRLVAIGPAGEAIGTFTRDADGSWVSGPMEHMTITALRLEDGSEIPLWV